MPTPLPKAFAALSPWQPLLDILCRRAEVYVVGGMVRDALRGTANDDSDVVTSAAETFVVSLLAQLSLKLVWRHEGLHEVTLRLWHLHHRKHLDLSLMTSADIISNLCRRDLTINAMAVRWPIADDWVPLDPCCGQRDIVRRCLRLLEPTEATLSADPIRLLRVARFLCLGPAWRMAPQTRRALTAEQVIKTASMPAERRRAELHRALDSPTPGRLVRFLQQLDGAVVFAPSSFRPGPHAWRRAHRGVECSARNGQAPWYWHLAGLVLGLVWPRRFETVQVSSRPWAAWLSALRLSRHETQEILDAAEALWTAPKRTTSTELAAWLASVRPGAWPLGCHLAQVAGNSRWLYGSRLRRAVEASYRLLGQQTLPTRNELGVDATALMATGLVEPGPQLGALLSHLWRFGIANRCWRHRTALMEEARRRCALSRG